MKKKIKKLSILLLALLIAFSMCACTDKKKSEDGILRIITTVYPPYDFARIITEGVDTEITMLLPAGMESHTYEPTAQDIIAISECDLFIYTGGDEDYWVEELLDSLGKDAPSTLTMMDCVDLIKEEKSADKADKQTATDTEEKTKKNKYMGYDRHVWTSPVNAIEIVQGIKNKLSEIDRKNDDLFKKNADEYCNKLIELDVAYRDMIKNSARSTIVVADRFPFVYLAEEYGLTYYAAFPGCAEESEPSAAVVASLTDEINSQGIPAIFTIEFSNQNVANAIAESTAVKILTLHSAHNVSKEDFDAGVGYYELMVNNLEALREALS